jgi:hypothetical protein
MTALVLLAGCGTAHDGSSTRTSITASPAPASGTSRSPAASPAARTTYFGQYGLSTHAYKPRRLNPSVDGSLYVRHVHWRVWTNRRAVGDGVAHVNDCVPNCAAGHYSTYPVVVHLSQPRELCGSRFFLGFRLSGSDYRTRAHWTGLGCR